MWCNKNTSEWQPKTKCNCNVISIRKYNVRHSNVPKTSIILMSFKIYYCIKASNNVIMRFWRIRHYAEQTWNVIVTLFLYLMQTIHIAINVISASSKISLLSKRWWAKEKKSTKIWPFYNVTSIHNVHVSTTSIVQRNSEVIRKRNPLSK